MGPEASVEGQATGLLTAVEGFTWASDIAQNVCGAHEVGSLAASSLRPILLPSEVVYGAYHAQQHTSEDGFRQSCWQMKSIVHPQSAECLLIFMAVVAAER